MIVSLNVSLYTEDQNRYSELMSAEDTPLITHARHRDYLESAVRHLAEFQAFREFFCPG